MRLLSKCAVTASLLLILMSFISVSALGIMVDPRIATPEQPSETPQKSSAELNTEMSSPKVTAPVMENMEESSHAVQAPEIPDGPDPDTLLLIKQNNHLSKKTSDREDKGKHSLILGLVIIGGVLGLGFGVGMLLTKFRPKTSLSIAYEEDDGCDDGRLIID